MSVVRTTVFIVGISIGLVSTVRAEPAARELVSPDAALVVEVDRPLQLVDNSLGRDVWDLLRETNGVKQALSSPEFEKFRQVARFIEKSLGVDWQTGVRRLTADGIVVAIGQKTSQAEPAVTAIVTAADEQTLKQFIDAILAEIHRSETSRAANPSGKAADAQVTKYRSYDCQRVGNGHFAVAGRRLFVSNSKAGLAAALDRLAGAAADKPFDPPASLRLVDSAGNAAAILVTANLKLLREDPKIRAGLTLPGNDPVPIVLLGGYLDLLRRADFAAAGLFVSGTSYELKIRFPVGVDGAYTGLRGYFASEPTESAPPLLRPAGTIFSAGWFRDYKKLWDARSELFSPDVVQKLEAENTKARSEGAKIGLADLVQFLGPHFRFVAARRQESVYKITLDEPLPALALVISVRDEPGFRQRVVPAVDSLLWLGVASANLGEIKPTEYHGAKISTLRFTEKPDVTDPRKLILYNFDPSYSLTRGHLIVGSTAELVRHLIDEIERLGAEAATPRPERPTDRQQLSLHELSELLRGYQARIVRGAVLNRGLAPADAEKEVNVLHQLLNRLGGLTVGNLIADDHFEFSLRLGPIEEKP
jgi:hypothetical protein